MTKFAETNGEPFCDANLDEIWTDLERSQNWRGFGQFWVKTGVSTRVVNSITSSVLKHSDGSQSCQNSFVQELPTFLKELHRSKMPIYSRIQVYSCSLMPRKKTECISLIFILEDNLSSFWMKHIVFMKQIGVVPWA